MMKTVISKLRGLIGDINIVQCEGDLEIPYARKNVDIGKVGGHLYARKIGGNLDAVNVRGDLNAVKIAGSLNANAVGRDLITGTIGGSLNVGKVGENLRINRVNEYFYAEKVGGNMIVNKADDITVNRVGGCLYLNDISILVTTDETRIGGRIHLTGTIETYAGVDAIPAKDYHILETANIPDNLRKALEAGKIAYYR